MKHIIIFVMLLSISLKAQDTVRHNPGPWIFEHEYFLDGQTRTGVLPRHQDQHIFMNGPHYSGTARSMKKLNQNLSMGNQTFITHNNEMDLFYKATHIDNKSYGCASIEFKPHLDLFSRGIYIMD